jgi:uncharacterized protein (DUF2249 family)
MIGKEHMMQVSTIDLRVFAPRYRQALLYAMIEGLKEGSAFSFSDDRDALEIEKELAQSDLSDYRWARANSSEVGDPAYVIERKKNQFPITSAESCCGCCCGESKAES